MKVCTNCGTVNKDENNFCNGCGSSSFTEQTDAAQYNAPAAPAVTYRKPDFTAYDLLTIFGFVASIIGNFVIALILEPLALAASIVGFAKGKRYRGLAIAAVVIAAIGLLIRLFITLHENGLIPEWIVTGTFD